MTDFSQNTDHTVQGLEPFTTAGVRWQQMAAGFRQRRMTQQPWTHLGSVIRSKYAAAAKPFSAIKQRVRDEPAPPVPQGNFLPDEAAALIAASEAPIAEPVLSPRSKQASLPDRAATLIAAAEAPIAEPVLSLRARQASLPDRAAIKVAAAETASDELPPAVNQSSHFLLDARLKNFLAELLNIRIPAVKIYANSASDALTKRYGADALTYRDSILFRSGKYNPQDAAGIALLGHELTHAAQLRMETRGHSSQVTTHVRVVQEQQALLNEARILNYVSSRDSRSPGEASFPTRQSRLPVASFRDLSSETQKSFQPASSWSSPTPNSYGQSGQPRAALSSREVSLPSEVPPTPNGLSALSEQQLKQIKEEVYRDLMNRIRTEFERGG